MSSRNVAVRKDVYDALRRECRPGESFTKLFVRLLHQKGPLVELNGSWGRASPAADARALRALRAGGSRR